MEIKINTHSSICIDGRIFVDPFKIQERGEAEYILITHPHFDHLDIESIRKIVTDNTLFVCTQDSARELEKHFKNKIKVASPCESFKLGDISCTTLPAYNTNKAFHKKEFGWVGYLLNIAGTRVAICGDCDATEELKSLKTDILLIPVGGTYTMTAVEASAVANIIKPKIAIPTHYGDIVGTEDDGKIFAQHLSPDIKCELLIK